MACRVGAQTERGNGPTGRDGMGWRCRRAGRPSAITWADGSSAPLWVVSWGANCARRNLRDPGGTVENSTTKELILQNMIPPNSALSPRQ